jgi:prepilin-type N-terminal cleavage/methylation domain-containing protein
MIHAHLKPARPNGFTLVEIAVVLVIFGLMLGGLFIPLSAQIEMRNYNDTAKKLEDIKEALIGYAMINGRLPCPATTSSNGLEDGSGGVCTTPDANNQVYIGFLPAATLGIYPQDGSGYAVDAWGSNSINRIRYAVSKATVNSVTNPFTTTNGIKSAGISYFNGSYIYVCNSKPSGSGPYSSCTSSTTLASNVVFVVYSVGKNAATGGASGDESVNPNPNLDDASNKDRVFVSHNPDADFDDAMVWATSSELISKLVTAGQLP